jgi:hypothetical protein
MALMQTICNYAVRARCLRSQVEARCIRATYDYRERSQRRLRQMIFRQERVETAKFANVTELHARDVIR